MTPRSAEELAQQLHEAAATKQTVIPVGGGKAPAMGNPPTRSDVLLQTTRLDRVLEHS